MICLAIEAIGQLGLHGGTVWVSTGGYYEWLQTLNVQEQQPLPMAKVTR